MSLIRTLKSQLFSEAECPPQGHVKRPQGRVAIRTLAVLYAEFPNPQQPKMLATAARVEYEACKKWLQRATGSWVVNVPDKEHHPTGWYRARATLKLLRNLGMDPLGIHRVEVVMPAPVSLARGVPPRLAGLGTPHPRDPNTRTTEWNGHHVTLQGHNDGGHTVKVRSSTKPFSASEFVELAAWLDGLAAPAKCILTDCDLNIDGKEHRYRFSGAQSQQLGDWTAAYVKAYNKQAIGATRIEYCFHRLDIGLSEAARLLNELATPPPPESFAYRPELMPVPGGQEVS